MASVLITGCNRGLGLELVKQLLMRHPGAPATLIATCRRPAEANELQDLANAHAGLHILQLDVDEFDSYDAFVQEVKGIVGDNGLNVLINNAGILQNKVGVKFGFAECTVAGLTAHFVTNAIAPIMLTKALLPLLRLAADANADQPMGWSRAAVVQMSSMLGSVGSNTEGDCSEYRESKAALNMASRTMSVELAPQNILVLVMHPGWVATDMGTSAAPVAVEDSVRGMLEVFSSLTPDQHGAFRLWDGRVGVW